MRVCDTLVGTHVFDTWKCGSISSIFGHPPEEKKKKKKKKRKGTYSTRIVFCFFCGIRSSMVFDVMRSAVLAFAR